MAELRDTNYYADLVAQRYPKLDPKVVRRVCRFVMRRMATLAIDGEDVLLQSSRYAVKLKIFLQDFNVEQHNREKEPLARARKNQRDRTAYFVGDGPRSRPPGKFTLKRIV